ncbi:MAG: TetR/AcrR family transcriptional regulator [Acetobacteraceae bacterium]
MASATPDLPSRPTRRARRKDARPGEILTAALALFAERGFAATRLEDVARRAGISKGTIYLYFPTKEDLFRAVVRRDLLPNLAAMEAQAEAHQGTAATLLADLATTMLRRLDGELAAIPKLVLTESGNFPALARFYAEEVAARGMRLIAGVLARGVARGEFRPIDVAAVVPLVVAPILLAMLWRTSIGRHTALAVDPAALLKAHLDLLLRGLAAGPA